MKISIILGTRPEIIKFSPIVRECDRLGLSYFIIHTGQHYSYTMDRVFSNNLSYSMQNITSMLALALMQNKLEKC